MGPLSIFFQHCATFFGRFSLSPKGPPIRVICYFATECMLTNPKRFPVYIFGHYATFTERERLSHDIKIFSVFFQSALHEVKRDYYSDSFFQSTLNDQNSS